jgi:hypothetical protein
MVGHRIAIALVALVGLCPRAAFAWNGLGHKVIADIAWSQLDEVTRTQIVETLRRHPRYEVDFLQQLPTDGEEGRSMFHLAATWADRIRGNKDFDHPTWHYVDFPVFAGPERLVTFNRETEPMGDRTQWNVMQAIAYNRDVVKSDALPADKAVAYCWLFHLVGDLHQPLHSTALVSEKFNDPNLGDKGGNLVLVTNGRNLHSLWDGLLGRREQVKDIAKEVDDLKTHTEWWKVDTKIDVPAWIAESHECCKAYVYSADILAAAEGPGGWAPLTLPESYLKAAGAHARERVVAAGLRLAAVLDNATTAPAEATAPGAVLQGVGR